eukprot:scaffold8010_cov258-Pinguiococcus_pyrenoidosus.AAC.1
MPDDLHDPKAMSQILKAPFIRKWYTQNLNRASLQGCCEAEQAKLVPIPMGVDFHSNTVAKSTRFFWTIALKYLGYRIHWSYSVWADRGRQMQLLETAKERALPPGERKNAVWSDVHLKHYASRFGDPRQALAEALEARKSDRGSLPIPVDAAEVRCAARARLAVKRLTLGASSRDACRRRSFGRSTRRIATSWERWAWAWTAIARGKSCISARSWSRFTRRWMSCTKPSVRQ